MSSQGNKKGDSSEDSAPLDLGLSALLSEDRTPSTDRILQSVGAQGEAASSILPAHTIPATPSQFETLLQTKSWAEMVKLAEAQLASNDEPELRLWWIRGHLGALSMPVSFLAAPLEAVCRRARDNQLAEQLLPVLRETGKLALARLKEVGARDQIETLRDSLFDAGALEAQPDLHSSVGQMVTLTAMTPSAQERTPVGGVKQGAGPAASPLRPERAVRGVRVPPLLGAVVILLLLVGGVWWWLQMSWSVPVVVAAENFLVEPVVVEQLVPSLERRGPVGSLSALFYSIERPEVDSRAGDATSGLQPTPDRVEQPQIISGNGVSSPAVAPPARPTTPAVVSKQKEQINTRSPVEGPDLKDRLRRRETRPRKPIEREPLARREVARDNAPMVMEERPAEIFDPGGVYRVLVRTSVLAHASHSAEVVGRLEPGDRVFVEAKLGRWVRLRSKRGRGGFVPAEDVAEVGLDGAYRR